MIKQILVPIDFSKCSLNALDYAAKMAQKMKVTPEIVILNAYTVPLAYSDINISFGPGVDVGDIETSIEEEFEDLIELVPSLAAVEYKCVKMHFPVTEAVNTYCEDNPIDMIVMGTLGASGVDEIVLGSNAHRVIKSNVAPVLVIPQNAQYKPIENMVLSNDYKGISDHSLNPLKAVQELTDAKVHLLHVSEKELLDTHKSLEAKNLDLYLKNLPHQFHFVQEENIEASLSKFIKEEAIDLLCIVPRKKGLFQSLFTKSHSRPLIFHTKIPLLTLIDS